MIRVYIDKNKIFNESGDNYIELNYKNSHLEKTIKMDENKNKNKFRYYNIYYNNYNKFILIKSISDSVFTISYSTDT
jgi:hypothetical protein